jgi:hypothetical protein
MAGTDERRGQARNVMSCHVRAAPCVYVCGADVCGRPAALILPIIAEEASGLDLGHAVFPSAHLYFCPSMEHVCMRLCTYSGWVPRWLVGYASLGGPDAEVQRGLADRGPDGRYAI